PATGRSSRHHQRQQRQLAHPLRADLSGVTQTKAQPRTSISGVGVLFCLVSSRSLLRRSDQFRAFVFFRVISWIPLCSSKNRSTKSPERTRKVAPVSADFSLILP